MTRFELAQRPSPRGALTAALLTLLGCHRPTIDSWYLHDPTFRRAELVASLATPDNDYSRRRLASYAVDEGWDRLPEWNPLVEPLRDGDDPRAPISAAATPLRWSGDVARDPAELVALGKTAFFRYPVQLTEPAGRVLTSTSDAARYGFWRDDSGLIGGLVKVALPGGRHGLAFTCASCHAAISDGRLVPGIGNAQLDLGRLLLDDARPDPTAPKARALAAWGPGRLDVTTTEGTEPIRFPDLRATRFQPNLQADATVVQRDVVSLGIRLETLVIVSSDEVVRPPREVALALAHYLWSMGDALPQPDRSSPGAAVFDRTCAGCHIPPAYSGPAVPLETVGTDPVVGRSRERGTGRYEVPSLRGVGRRGRLLHDGSFTSLSALLDSRRAADHLGHHYGLQLTEAERAALLGFLSHL